MNDVKTWAQIDASPLLQLPPEQRKALHVANDDRFRTFWADCFAVMLAAADRKEEELNSEAFCKVFLAAFDLWVPKPGQTFSVYLRGAMKHESAREKQEQESTTGFRRETNRKVKKALEYMDRNGITEGMLARSPEALQSLAGIVGVGEKTLLTALQNKQTVLSLDDPGDGDSTLGDCLADETGSVEQQAEQTADLLPWLHRSIGLMNLAQKEAYGRDNGALWSSILLGFLRNGDALPPAGEIPGRLANCDDLRPLEQDNCLWDILLLRSYVAFTVCPPHTPEELERAALNELLQPGRNPARDTTVAAFLDVSKEAVSQRRKTWRKKLLQLRKEQEER